jgi:hypothetical protein
MARILLHDDLTPNPDAGIVLLSYRPAPLLPYESDKSPCRYAYGPISLAPFCLANRQASRRYAYETILITCRADKPTTQTRLGRASLPIHPTLLLKPPEPVAGIVLLPLKLPRPR